MDYAETLTYLFKQLPMYQRIGKAAYKSDLQSTIAFCMHLDNPQRSFPSIHIAGTNGKGSVSHMLASVLQEAGYNTGLYTSPHFKDFRERIKINGEMISKSWVRNFVTTQKAVVDDLHLSFFEWTAGLAFAYFNARKIDIAVIETGMGGRLDSTNVITPVLCVITNIALDHTVFLGHTIEEIAKEKAGIVKTDVPVVWGGNDPIADAVIEQQAGSLSAPFYKLQVDEPEAPSMSGMPFHEQNKRIAYEVVKVLRKKDFIISDRDFNRGILGFSENTGFMGRWQTIGEKPLTICDMGHNKHAWKQLQKMISKVQCNRKHMVIGMVSDKPHEEVLRLMPTDASYYFCKADIPRALPAGTLKEKALACGLKGEDYVSVAHALKAARAQADDEDFIFVGGSAFVVAEAL